MLASCLGRHDAQQGWWLARQTIKVSAQAGARPCPAQPPAPDSNEPQDAPHAHRGLLVRLTGFVLGVQHPGRRDYDDIPAALCLLSHLRSSQRVTQLGAMGAAEWSVRGGEGTDYKSPIDMV